MRAAVPLSIALIVSVAMNVVMLYRSMADENAGAVVETMANGAVTPPGTESMGSLNDRGLTGDETKAALLASAAQCRPSNEQGAPYWRKDWAAERFQARLREAECREQVLARVAQVLGPEGAHDALFRALFNPVAELEFLSPRDQYAAERHNLEAQLKAANDSPARATRVNAANPGASPPQQPLAVTLGEFLDPAAVLEVLLRYSPLADSIRVADVARSEDEFRFVFVQFQALEAPGGTPRNYLEVREALKARLGRERFNRVWAARDPLFAAMAQSMEALGRNEATAVSAYEIVNDTQDALATALLRSEADPVRAQSDVRAALEAQTTRLAGLLGAEGAQRITAVLAMSAVEMADPSQYPRVSDEAGN